ncbi:MAG: hypothetical protein MJ010_01505 [Paludibacteraceae bacterium]|nr:hypothetical protein [Paludibacteraceae bacterium]
MQDSYFNIAEFIVRLNVTYGALGSMENLYPFIAENAKKADFQLLLGCDVKLSGSEIYKSDEYDFTIFESESVFCIKFTDIASGNNYLLEFDKDFKEYRTNMSAEHICRDVLNNMLMLAFTFATIDKKSLMIHASVAVLDGKAYLFLGKSGTGKSTHCRLWLKNFKNADILNDDNPVLKFENGETVVYGSPWSGKGAVYKNECYKVGGIARLSQAPYNKIECRTGAKAFALLYSSCSKLPWSESCMSALCATLSDIVGTTPVYYLECLPDDAAAQLSHSTMTSHYRITTSPHHQ